MSEIFLGIDIGGTKTAMALVELPAGRVSWKRNIPTPPPELSGADFLALVVDEARLVGADGQTELAGIGVGICELIGPAGVIDSGHRVRWQGLPVVSRFSTIALAVLTSDVHAAALAEARLGAGQAFGDFLYINIGTGISSALVIDGAPRLGVNGHALVMASHAGDGGRVLENFAGGAGLANSYGTPAANVSDLEDLASAGDANAKAILSEGAAMLGGAFAMLLGALDPAALIFGGGVGCSDGPYMQAVITETRARIWSPRTRTLPIMRAALGPEAGLIGAALAAAQAISSPKLR